MKVFILDDDVLLGKQILRMNKSYQHEVIFVSSKEEFLKISDDVIEKQDVFILDFWLDTNENIINIGVLERITNNKNLCSKIISFSSMDKEYLDNYYKFDGKIEKSEDGIITFLKTY